MTQNQKLGWAEKEARRDYLRKSARGGEGASVVGIVLVALFFYAHQAWSTGFFTAGFGSLAAFLLYGSIILGVAGPVARSVTGSRNSARPPEIFASIFSTISGAFLLVYFPFNFVHFGDVIPDFLRFLVSWITNDIAWILLAIGTVGGIFFVSVTSILFLKIRALLQSGRMYNV